MNGRSGEIVIRGGGGRAGVGIGGGGWPGGFGSGSGTRASGPRRVLRRGLLPALAALSVALSLPCSVRGQAHVPLDTGLVNTRWSWWESRVSDRWYPVYMADTVVISVDLNRIVTEPGGASVAWFRWDFKRPQRYGTSQPAHSYTLNQVRVRCPSLAYTQARIVYYAQSGDVVGDWEPSYPRQHEAIPGTIGETIYSEFCTDPNLAGTR